MPSAILDTLGLSLVPGEAGPGTVEVGDNQPFAHLKGIRNGRRTV